MHSLQKGFGNHARKLPLSSTIEVADCRARLVHRFTSLLQSSMFNFLRTGSLQYRRSVTASTSRFLRPFSVQCCSDYSKSLSFTASYLVNSCGFPPKYALSVCKRVRFETPERPDSVLAFFKDHGFSNSQLLLVIKSFPSLLMSKPEKTISPKLEFLRSKGLSIPEIAKIFASNPMILKRSLEKCLIPRYNFLRNFLQSDEKTAACIRRYSPLLSRNLETHVEFNSNALRSAGVPQSHVIYFLHYQPRMFRYSRRTRETVEAVKNMGFNPSRVSFMEAVHAVLSMTKSNWAEKVNVYKKWGWSEEDVLAAFRIRPRCMTLSADKITASMDYFINKLGWNSSHLVKSPFLLLYRLDTRVIPRASVLQFLLERGLVVKALRSSSPYSCSDQIFLHKFVLPYLKEAPRLLKIYEQSFDTQIQQI